MLKHIKNWNLFLEMKNKDVKKRYKYGCIMLYFKNNALKDVYSKIDDDDVYDEEGFGIETKSHITLLYGLHDEEIEDSDIFDLVMKEDYPEITLYNVSIFEGKEFDVLKFDVKSPEIKILKKVNKSLVDTFPYTTDYPDYHPHCTIAYLKSGMGKKWVKEFKNLEIVVKSNKIVYSKSDGEKIQKYIKD